MDFRNLTQWLDSLLQHGIPASETMISFQGKTVYHHTVGFSDENATHPVTERDIYWLYSLSKPMTACAVMQLVESGKVELDVPVNHYLPELPAWTVRDADGVRPAHEAPTIRQLLSMRGGLNYDLNAAPIRECLEKSGGLAGTRELVAAIAREPLQFEPGTHFNYSLCHDVLGAVVEAVSGQSFGEYMKQHIFTPLGMKDTGFTMTKQQRDRLSTPYMQETGTTNNKAIGPENGFRLSDSYESGGAGIFSVASDYLLFAEAMSNGGVGRTGNQILKPETIDLLRTDQMDDICRKDFDLIGRPGYSYGLGVRTMIDPKAGNAESPIGEFGWDGAAGSYALMDPENHLAVVYMQHVHNCSYAYSDIHPTLRNYTYRAIFNR